MDRARKHFRCTDAERAVFEAAIKLAMVFHQFVGVPVTRTSRRSLENAIEEAVKIQPWVVSARARIDLREPCRRRGLYGYRTLDGRMLRVRVETEYGTARARCAMQFVRDLDYPLMYIERVGPAGARRRRSGG
ncbi:MAG: dihydroneopterin aldolase [Euryarchaeota archaeon]|nr:dihydroneopterin aldolase [Euryarchaeota archaeon]